MEANLNQTVSFISKAGKAKSDDQNLFNNPELLFTELSDATHKSLLQGHKNRDMIVVSMLQKCADRCINSTKIDALTKSEETCVTACQYKYLNSVKTSLGTLNSYLKTELPENKSAEVNSLY